MADSSRDDVRAGEGSRIVCRRDSRAGFRDIVLLGMGGSSQSAELFATTFPSAPRYPKLHVLDTTVPEAIRSLDRNIDISKTLFVVASKTGETIETLSHFKSFLSA